ncbi:MAG: M20/M25/M40 family metallo-hydrolase [Candidatus Heimdallarchaeota archaeon]
MEEKLLNESVELLQELVRNKCINPPGDEMKSIKTVKKFLTDKGISCQIFESAPNRGNLIARIKGIGEGKSLMFGPSHVDVVPIEDPDAWEVPPFSGEIKDGQVWGRGTFDMLFIVVAQCQAFAMLHKENFKPKGDLILAIVADEEAGGLFGTKWMIDNHPEVMKVDNAVSEFGGLQIAENKLILPYGEKGVVGIRLTFKGESGHASRPFGIDSSINKLARAIVRINKYKMPYTTKYLKHIAKGFGVGFLQRQLLSRKILLPIAMKMMKKEATTLAGSLHAMSSTTFATTIIKGGQKINVLPASCSVDIDCRILPGQDYDYAIKHLKKALGRKLAKEAIITPIEDSMNSTGTVSPLDTDFVESINRTYQKFFPDSSTVPVIAYGGTDLRFIREAGGHGYGFSLVESSVTAAEASNLAHNKNERISIKSVELSTEAMYELAKDYLG